jgi:hydroxymethylpyrimidine pyrophosphatase-like HAD family hydrolase
MEAERRLNEHDELFAYQIDLANLGARLLESFAKGVTKWTAIARVAEMKGINPSKTIAIGDDMNDVHMIQHAGLGVAMGNARQPVKELADRIIASHVDDGLAEFLEELAG